MKKKISIIIAVIVIIALIARLPFSTISPTGLILMRVT